MPYNKLSDYGFFIGDLKDQNPKDDLFYYEPITPLFTDYAKKKRFIWIPQGEKASFVAGNKLLDFPVGTILIKTFYYDNVQPASATLILETRLMIKQASGWIFAEYVWNDDQTEAYLDMSGSNVNISWYQDGEVKSTNYRIPSETECLICHKFNSNPIPIGVKPMHMNTEYNYSSGMNNQLQQMVDMGYLLPGFSNDYETVVDYLDETQPISLRLRSYLDMNCAHCHSENSHCDYRPIRLEYEKTGLPINLGVCVPPDENISPVLIDIIVPGNYVKSNMHFRLASTEESTRMPLLGRSLVHEEALELLEAYISSLDNCD
jgi:uncharacterized repeat protein (TIGR03806 family)